jgi:hypothetical protein
MSLKLIWTFKELLAGRKSILLVNILSFRPSRYQRLIKPPKSGNKGISGEK